MKKVEFVTTSFDSYCYIVNVLVKELGFDHAINYKTEKDLTEAIRKVAPQGVDVFFDNVGGKTLDAVSKVMNNFGRIAACGSISTYNTGEPSLIGRALITKRLKIQVSNQISIEYHLLYQLFLFFFFVHDRDTLLQISMLVGLMLKRSWGSGIKKES